MIPQSDPDPNSFSKSDYPDYGHSNNSNHSNNPIPNPIPTAIPNLKGPSFVSNSFRTFNPPPRDSQHSNRDIHQSHPQNPQNSHHNPHGQSNAAVLKGFNG